LQTSCEDVNKAISNLEFAFSPLGRYLAVILFLASRPTRVYIFIHACQALLDLPPSVFILILLFSSSGHRQSAEAQGNCPTQGTTAYAGPIGVIDSLQIQGGIKVPVSVTQNLIEQLKKQRIRLRVDPDWLAELKDITVKGAWTDEGFLEAEVSGDSQLLYSDSVTQHYYVSLHVNEGAQYRLDTIRFRKLLPRWSSSDLAEATNNQGESDSSDETQRSAIGEEDRPFFSDEELRKQIPLLDGEIFRTDKILEGIENLKKLYGSHGFVDFAAAPTTDLDKNTNTASLMLYLDEEQQYRIGKIQVIGLDSATQARLSWVQKPGEIYDDNKIPRFFEINEHLLPHNYSVQTDRDLDMTGMDITFDFRPCRSPAN
jgi:hypothetical protein